MAAFVFFQQFIADAMNGEHDLAADTLKVMLTNTAPTATDTTTADITEITAENGYTAGGETPVAITSTQTGGVYTLGGSYVQLTPSGGSFGPFRYAVLYNTENDMLIGYWDVGSPIAISPPNYFKITFDGGAVFTIQ